MKNHALSALALVAGLATALPAVAQQTAERLAGETALEMAQRLNVCDAAGIASASFANGGNVLRVNCVGAVGGNMQGGLGTAAAAGGVAVAVAAFAAGGSSSSTTTTSAAD